MDLKVRLRKLLHAGPLIEADAEAEKVAQELYPEAAS